MTGFRHRVRQRFQDDEQDRLEYDLNAFAVAEGRTHLGELFRYWQSLARHGLALADDFMPAAHLAEPVTSTCAWVDTSAGSPEYFVMRDHPVMPNGPFGQELSGVRLIDFPVQMHAHALMMEYARCQREGRPIYHEIDQIIGGVSRAYRRIMLPLADRRGRIVRVAYGFRFLREPVILPSRKAAP